MRISDWSSDVCFSDLQPTDRVARFFDAAGIVERAARNNPNKAKPGEKAVERAETRAAKAAEAEEAANAAANAPAEEEAPAEEVVAEAPAEETAAEAPAQEEPANEGVSAEAPAEGAVDARSEEHTSELQTLMRISYAVFCLKKKKQ